MHNIPTPHTNSTCACPHIHTGLPCPRGRTTVSIWWTFVRPWESAVGDCSWDHWPYRMWHWDESGKGPQSNHLGVRKALCCRAGTERNSHQATDTSKLMSGFCVAEVEGKMSVNLLTKLFLSPKFSLAALEISGIGASWGISRAIIWYHCDVVCYSMHQGILLSQCCVFLVPQHIFWHWGAFGCVVIAFVSGRCDVNSGTVSYAKHMQTAVVEANEASEVACMYYQQ